MDVNLTIYNKKWEQVGNQLKKRKKIKGGQRHLGGLVEVWFG